MDNIEQSLLVVSPNPSPSAMSLRDSVLALFSLLSLLSLTLAIPSFEGVINWSSIGSLVPGMTTLEAIGPATFRNNGDVPYYFTIDAPYGERVPLFRGRRQPFTS